MNQKYESDMTPKEKRQQEIEKLKSMTFKQKIEHLWAYYKIWLVFLIVAILIVNIGITMYRSANKNVLAGIAIVDSVGAQDIENMQDIVKEWLGAEGENDDVSIYKGASGTTKVNGIADQAAFTTWIAGKEIDIVIGSKEMYENFEQQGFLKNIEEALGDSAEKYSEFIEGNALVLENTDEMKEKLGILSDEVYIAFIINGQHPENARKVVESLLETFYF